MEKWGIVDLVFLYSQHANWELFIETVSIFIYIPEWVLHAQKKFQPLEFPFLQPQGWRKGEAIQGEAILNLDPLVL